MYKTYMKTVVKMNKPIDKIFPHPKNPRLIRNEKYLEQKKSIEETPEMMDLRPVIIDEDDIILGGHQRWRACKELGWKDVPVMQYTREKHLKSESFTKFNKTYELVCAEIVIKDNTHYGQFDYDILANEWDVHPLVDWGIDVWQPETDLNLDEFFAEPDLQEEQNKYKIILEYNEDEYNKLMEVFEKISGSKESIIYKLLTDEK